MQLLMAEALDDLFAKHELPEIAPLSEPFPDPGNKQGRRPAHARTAGPAGICV